MRGSVRPFNYPLSHWIGTKHRKPTLVVTTAPAHDALGGIALQKPRPCWSGRGFCLAAVRTTTYQDGPAMNDVTISILIVGAVILVALAIVYFGLVRRRL